MYEAAGLDIVWVGESYGFDAVSAMGALVMVTSRVQIDSSVLSVYSRTFAMIATSVAGVDALSGGRALLGLGASGPQVVEGWHGVPSEGPIGRTRCFWPERLGQIWGEPLARGCRWRNGALSPLTIVASGDAARRSRGVTPAIPRTPHAARGSPPRRQAATEPLT